MKRTAPDRELLRERDAFPLATGSDAKPLQGVRVIDAGNMVAAPFATVLMADLGADVIKIEHPRDGDAQRKLGPIKDGTPLWWKSVSRNKRCVTLDLGNPEGAEVFKELLTNCDVVVENFRPGTFERWGLGYEVLEAINPGLVMLRISGFGQSGPYRERPGFGRVAEAMSGLTHLIGEPDGPPMSPGYPLGDLITGVFGAYAIMVALYHRDARGGTGQLIDLALYEAVFRLLDYDAMQYDQLETIHTRTGNAVAYAAPSSTFRTADGKFVTMAATTQNVWLRLCQAMEREDLRVDPKFIDNPARVRHSGEINGIVADWMAQHTRDEVIARFDRFAVAYSPIFDIQDIFRDPQYQARATMVRVADPDLGETIVPNVVPRFSATPGSVGHLGACLGAHNEEIYRGLLGYTAEKLERLRRNQVI